MPISIWNSHHNYQPINKLAARGVKKVKPKSKKSKQVRPKNKKSKKKTHVIREVLSKEVVVAEAVQNKKLYIKNKRPKWANRKLNPPPVIPPQEVIRLIRMKNEKEGIR